MDASELYDTDFVLWTEQQAAALRCLAGGSNTLDIEHLAEEIEDLGKRDVREVESYIRLILLHGLKIVLSPDSSYVPHWRSEIVAFQTSARAGFTQSMRQVIVFNDQWMGAVRVVAAERPGRQRLHMIEAAEKLVLPPEIGDMVSAQFDVDMFIDQLATALRSAQFGP